jgi:SecD/SecF fusion protein
MKSYSRKLIVCLVPMVIAAIIVGVAYKKYLEGKGGFRLGVDLVGGTILVYEVDKSKLEALAQTNVRTGQNQKDYDSALMAEMLKRRIDPADLYNVTVRPIGTGDRFEIILPTGGRRQTEAENKAWDQLLEAVQREFPAPAGKHYTDVPRGNVALLTQRIRDYDSNRKPEDVSAFIEKNYAVSQDKRMLSSDEVQHIKELISQQGRLEFLILANRTDDTDAIKIAEEYLKNPANRQELERRATLGQPPPGPRPPNGDAFTITVNGEEEKVLYRWVEVGKNYLYQMHLNSGEENDPRYGAEWKRVAAARDREAISPPFDSNLLLYSRTIPDLNRLSPQDRLTGKKYEYFLLTRVPADSKKEVTGDFLTSATSGFGNQGTGLAVHFRFNGEGASRFGDLTNVNRPTGNKESGFKRHLAIVLDEMIQSAPTINDRITYQGIIEGNFTQAEVDNLVSILRSGALPATLKRDPVSENTMGATLGEDTIVKGTRSVLWAFAAVLAFMIVYYRFAGLVACVALLGNLLLTVAVMVLINATFTLPGLAGLVLTLGMAVDANVLIYERLREERERGASLALAIRNGYDRAFPTIIDTHLTSIFTAIVLYVVGNDQLKGFGISLTIGLIISLFTSLFVTRTIFDVWQSHGWLKNLSMMQLFRRPNWDFMSIRYYWFTATILLTIAGAAVFLHRGKEGLNIDFTGGTAYTGVLNKMVDISTLRNDLKGLDETKVPDASIEQIFINSPEFSQGDTSRLFTVRTSQRDATVVQDEINRVLGDKLRRVEIDQFTIDPSNTRATLKFINGETGQPDYASPGQVGLLLSRELADQGLSVKQFRLVRAEEVKRVPASAMLALGPMASQVPGLVAATEPGGEEQDGRYTKMTLELPEAVDRAKLEAALKGTQEVFHRRPQPERLENFDSQLAADTQKIALYAILASWAAILLFLWFRFGSWTFGAAAVLCLIHDLFFTIGAIAFCHYIHLWVPGFATILGIQDFKIDLPAVAALLTLVGYSVSDTIVVFDRIREVRGKNPALTPQMINDSVNQTLSRTVLSSLTVWLVVIVLYAFGGEGVHLFAFVMVVGVIVGTYSSIYIASPLLLIFGEGTQRAPAGGRVAAQPAAAQG